PAPPGAGPPFRDDWWIWLVVLLALVLGGLALAYFLTRDDDGDGETTVALVSVPTLVGLERTAAVEAVERTGLAARVREVPSDEEEGTVVAQQPGPGARAPRGSRVAINISGGPQRVEVPNLIGLSEAQAGSELADAGLEARVFRVPSNEPQGEVIAQNPEAGEQLDRGASVRINVSRGAPPTPATTTVPDLVGLTRSEATQMLTEARLVPNFVTVPSQEAAGTVVAQNPPGGTSAPSGSRVRVNVAG
ncbi:MAG: PASTA domain-containing protein, partial [Actinomycetota bacterium]|nr:PASTA domain-containing protein [Actinomycetota bacterium]